VQTHAVEAAVRHVAFAARRHATRRYRRHYAMKQVRAIRLRRFANIKTLENEKDASHAEKRAFLAE